MTPALLLPAALAALTALAVPLLIHIARRTESRTIDFAALRWLDAKTKPRRRPRLDELLLLAARLLLLALLAVWLARPVLEGLADDRPVVAIAPGLDVSQTAADARSVWLAPGFPATDQTAPSPPANLISLVRQLDAELPPSAPLEIVVPATLDGVDAQRPVLSRRVTWRVVPDPRPLPAPEPTLPPALVVRYGAASADQVRYFRAAATAWTDPGLRPDFDAASTSEALPDSTRHLVWLSPGPVPNAVTAWTRNGGVLVVPADARLRLEGETTPVWRGPDGAPLAVAGRFGRGRVVQFTRPLEPAANPQLVEPGFPDALAAMLAPAPAPARVGTADHAPLTGAAPYDQPPFDLRPWLALLIAGLFVGERWLATRRSRRPAP